MKIQVHRKGIAALLGIVLLVVLAGPVQAIAVLRAVTVLVALVALVRSLFISCATMNCGLTASSAGS